VNSSILQTFYQALASGRHLNELIVLFLLIGLMLDGYAVLSAVTAFNRWIHHKLRNQNPPMQRCPLPQTSPPAQSDSSPQDHLGQAHCK
jgi:hypothetical protein